MDGAIRKAVPEGVPQLEALIAQSVRGLQAADYSAQQLEGALGTVFGVDRLLIEDGTYFVVESAGRIVACGGWSRRRTLFGSDHSAVKDDAWLDPAVEAARIRAFFVHPGWARRGLGSRIMRECEAEARAFGFTRLELMATLTGEPLYRRHGFQAAGRIDYRLASGVTMALVPMSKEINTPPR